MRHEIKLQEQFCEAVYLGYKPFEIRYNDRGYQKGDEVIFIPVDKNLVKIKHPVADWIYRITYVMSGFGIGENYVVFGIRQTNMKLVSVRGEEQC